MLNDIEVNASKKNSFIKDYEGRIRILNTEMNFKDTQIDGLKSELSLKDSQIKNIESKLINKNIRIDNLERQLKTTNNVFESISQQLRDKDIEINELTNKIIQNQSNYNMKINSIINELTRMEQNFKNSENEYIEQIKIKDSQINFLKNDFIQKENDFEKEEGVFNNKINSKNAIIEQKDIQLKNQQKELNDKNIKLQSLEHCYKKQLSIIDNDNYHINCLKDKLSNNDLEIKYLKNNNLTKKIFSPFAYLYLIIKSNPKEIFMNIKLYGALRDSDYFDIGFYLNQNRDLVDSKWCKYFSPELHYVCKGFKEKRTFNGKYFNRKSKKDLLEYISD